MSRALQVRAQDADWRPGSLDAPALTTDCRWLEANIAVVVVEVQPIREDLVPKLVPDTTGLPGPDPPYRARFGPTDSFWLD